MRRIEGRTRVNCVASGSSRSLPQVRGGNQASDTLLLFLPANIRTCVTGGPSAKDPFSKRASGAKQATHSNPFGDGLLPTPSLDGDGGGRATVSGQERRAEPEGEGLQLGLKDLDTGGDVWEGLVLLQPYSLPTLPFTHPLFHLRLSPRPGRM